MDSYIRVHPLRYCSKGYTRYLDVYLWGDTTKPQQKGGDIMSVQNTDFICGICGQPDIVASKVILEANYGSANDGERVTLDVCGNCIDKLFAVIASKEL